MRRLRDLDLLRRLFILHRKNIMKELKRYEVKHNSEIDERFHQLNAFNIGLCVYWYEYFRMIKNIPGDIVECGVGRGRSLTVISTLNTLLEPSEGGGRKIFAYDSFCGFPEPCEKDNSYRSPKAGEWSTSPSGKYSYSPEFTRHVLSEAGISKTDIANLSLTPGFFCDTLPTHPNRPIALLHCDGDLYESYRDCLLYLFPKLVSGGIIVFDDFYFEKPLQEKFPGARLAVEEFFGDDIKLLKKSLSGASFFIKA